MPMCRVKIRHGFFVRKQTESKNLGDILCRVRESKTKARMMVAMGIEQPDNENLGSIFHRTAFLWLRRETDRRNLPPGKLILESNRV